MKAFGAILLVAVLTIGFGCARPDWIERTLVTVDVTGTWEGSIATSVSNLGPHYIFSLKQEGPHVIGSVQRTGAGSALGSGPIDGDIAGDVFRFKQTNGSLAGELTVSGEEMTGTVYTSPGGPRLITVRRVKAGGGDPQPPKQ